MNKLMEYFFTFIFTIAVSASVGFVWALISDAGNHNEFKNALAIQSVKIEMLHFEMRTIKDKQCVHEFYICQLQDNDNCKFFIECWEKLDNDRT